jgi:hypothetical protein
LHSSYCTLLLLHSSCQRFCCILPVISVQSALSALIPRQNFTLR